MEIKKWKKIGRGSLTLKDGRTFYEGDTFLASEFLISPVFRKRSVVEIENKQKEESADSKKVQGTIIKKTVKKKSSTSKRTK